MSDKNKSSESAGSSDSAIAAVLRNPYLTWTIVIVIVLVLIVLTIITVLAFAQGRRVSIFGLEIEAAPTSQANPLSPTAAPVGTSNINQISDSNLVSGAKGTIEP